MQRYIKKFGQQRDTDTAEIKAVMRSQQESVEEFFSKEKIIDREASTYAKYLSHPNALFITGLRRSGKSVLAILLAKATKYMRVNFDDERLYGMEANELGKVLEAGYSLYGSGLQVVILDEIQNVPGWELFVSRLRDSMGVIVTGSNARLLSKEMATRLTGRHTDLLLYPFSFKEFLEFRSLRFDEYSTRSRGEVLAAFGDYVKVGGIPDVVKIGIRVSEDIKRDIILRDVVARYRIRNERVFHELTRFLLNNFGRETSFNRLKNAFDLRSVHTAADYVSYAEDAFLILTIERYSAKTLSRYTMPRKVYAIDQSFIGKREEAGRILENIVLLKIKQKISYDETGEEVYYWRDEKGEVDFVLAKGGRVRRLIQVTSVSEVGEADPREIRTLAKVGRQLHCRELLVITSGLEDEMAVEGAKVRFIPVLKFLLS
jgi:predicted AAA+ superfamily ATPase